MTIYQLKNGEKVESVPIGKAKIKLGTKINRLTACDRGPNPKSKKTQIICQCECGNYTMINLQDFLGGKVKSCGCYSSELKAQRCSNTAIDFSLEINNINPFYKYVRPTSDRKRDQVVWEIECRKCGKHYYDIPSELISHKRTHGNNPCECYRIRSVGAQKIINILQNNNIMFEMEKTFDNCVSPKNKCLPFDFYLPDYNTLIEYDGEQHYKICFGQSEEKLLKQQEYDKIKTEWCNQNNIKLVRIPYFNKNVKLEDLIVQ